MKLSVKSILFALPFAVCAATAVQAEDQTGQDAHGAFKQACGQDIQTYCGSAASHEERHACVQANKDKFSDGCKAFMASHPWHHHDNDHDQGTSGGQ